MDLQSALNLAQEKNLDLVEIARDGNPPVAKIIDFGKFKYEKEKSFKENKKKQKVSVVKEIKVKPQIDLHDLEIKRKKITTFLEEGKKVKVILVLRGRQRLYAERGLAMLDKIAEGFEDIAIIEKTYSLNRTVLLTPKK